MIKINIHIEADSVEEAREAFAQLGSGSAVITTATPSTVEAPAPVTEKPKTRSRAATAEKPAEAVVVPMNTSDPLASTAAPVADPLAAPAPVADPLASASTPSADPLAATSAPVADPLASAAPAQTAAPATTSITLQTIREKIGTLTDKKQQAKELIGTFKKADGTPCEKPSDIQEKDYEAVYNDLDYI